MNEIILYHRSDLDGHCSGAIAKIAHPTAELHGIEYGDEIPWDKINEARVIMVDFSLQPWSEMERLNKDAAEVIWIDHHRSAINEYRSRDPWKTDGKIVLEEGKAACELAWEHFFPDVPMPRLVHLLGRYDVWDLDADPQVLALQMGMRLKNLNPSQEEAMDWWSRELSAPDQSELVTCIANDGNIVSMYQKQCNERLMSKAFELDWRGFRWLAVNAGGINSQACESKFDKEKHDGFMSFFWTGKLWTVSLYAPAQNQDFSGIAKDMGGGGHPAACGFQLETIAEIITNIT